jgi:glycosyltransferase involved in cell wall biosynthesis
VKIVCISDSINHHTAPLYDEFYRILKEEFVFIETGNKKNRDLKGGDPSDFKNLPYWKDGFSNRKRIKLAKEICLRADVVIQFSSPNSFIFKRLKKNKLTFRVSERFCTGSKKDYFRFIKYFLKYNIVPHEKLFLLSASAYAPKDMWRSHAYRDKCYKWGYFPEIFKCDAKSSNCQKLKILWVGRFIKWKHPEVCIEIANFLKNRKIDFNFMMIGDGLLLKEIKSKVVENSLDEYFTFPGNIGNKDVQLYMKEADIFVFSSDKNEGWGAVLNEAMGNGCIPIASNEAGSVPYLIRNGYNGFVYKSGDKDDLINTFNQVVELDSKKFANLKENASRTIMEEWSAKSAVKNLLELIDNLENNQEVFSVGSGPARKALVLNEEDCYK